MSHSGSFATTTSPENQYLYNGKEKQDELNLGWYDYGARMYDVTIGRWNGVDALADDPDQVDKSSYAFSWNNPINYIDPTGLKPEWVPDSKGNLIAEKGDNAQKLADYQGITYTEALKQLTDQGYTVDQNGILDLKIGDKVELDNVFTESIQSSTSDYDTDAYLAYNATKKLTGTGPTPEDFYNCYGAACAGSQGKKIEVGVGIPGSTFDANLTSDYTATTGANAQFGKTVLRFAVGGNIVQHGAVFYGESSNGTTYVYTKNGWGMKPEVMKLSDLQLKLPSYGTVKGINTGESGYYDPK
ncbi:MAG: RHS repeat-associated core domain-containing protein [Bacteroidota bacterium]